MGEILDRAWRRRAVLSLPVLVVLVMVCGVMAAGARAAVPSAMTFTPGHNSASFTGHVNMSNFLQPTCDQSVTPQCAPGTSPTPCPMQAADATNLVCEHFTATIAPTLTQGGTLQFCVSFPPDDLGLNDVDLRNARIEGDGWNNGHAVHYVVQVQDNLLGSDSFSLTLSDGKTAAGTLTSGSIAYSS
jgi:hypothetical protein